MPCARVCCGAESLFRVLDLTFLSYPGPEHSATEAGSGQPSYCTLPLFHPLKRIGEPINGLGYISNDGHLFGCRSPAVVQQAFHV